MSSTNLERWNLYGAQKGRAAIVVHAPDTTIVWANDEAARLLGISRDALTGKLAADPSFRLFDERKVELPVERYPVVLALQTGEPVDDYIVGTTHEGATCDTWGKISADPVFEDGELQAVVVTFVDVTELQEARRALAASEERLAFTVAGTSEGLWEAEFASERAWFSDRFLELLGLPPGGLAPHAGAWAQRVHPDDREALKEAIAGHLERDEPYDVRYRIRHADGGWRWFRSRAKAIRDANGRPLRIGGAVADITAEVAAEAESRQTRARLEEAQRLEALGLLAGGIAHDFNNLLVGVLGAADTALEVSQNGEDVGSLLSLIVDSATRARDLTRHLLAYAGRGATVIEIIDANEVLEEILRLTRGSLIQAELIFDAGDAPPIRADATQLRQVCLNLLTNANDAMEGRGRIEVSTGQRMMRADALRRLGAKAEAGLFTTITVRDDGPGMDVETRERIFEPFFTTKEKGHGLGLAAVHGVLREHGGFIDVESAPGAGARFQIGFPAYSGAAATRTPTAAMPAMVEGRRALVVDDEATVRQVLQRVLSRRGFEVETRLDGNGLLEALAARPPDLLVLDLTMPGPSGPPLFARVREVFPDLPILIASGYSDFGAEALFSPENPTRFLAKPFTVAELSHALALLLPAVRD